MKAIKEWQIEERPREKLEIKGAESLSNSELLAILLRSGTKTKNALDLAREILDQASGRLGMLTTMSIEKLTKARGIGKAKAITILAALELGKRLCTENADPFPQIISSRSVYEIMSPYMKDLLHEECWIMYLNRANKLISKEKMSTGGISSTIVDVKMIMKNAVEKLASGIVMIHNHPSGSCFPGEQDKKQTKALKEAASLFEISLLDHIIIAVNKYYSFSDENF